MHASILGIALLLIPISHPRLAPSPAQPTGTLQTAKADAPPPEGRTVQCSGIVNASADELWKTFTTPEGWTGAIGVAKCEIDFRLGGTVRTVYDPKATIGDDSTITNTIIAYEPKRMIAFKPTSPKAAPDFIKAICETGWNVIRFEPLAPDRTRLTVTGMGYREGELYDKAFEFFDKGNAWTLKKIQDHFATPEQAASVDEAEKMLSRLCGKWSFAKEQPDGSKIGGTTDGRMLFDGKVLVVDGFLTFGGGTIQHSHLVAGLDPETRSLRAWNFNEQGDLTEGEIRLEAHEKLVIDWNTFRRSDGRFIDYRVEYTFNGPDEFRCVVLHAPEPDGTRKTLVDVTYERVATSQSAEK